MLPSIFPSLINFKIFLLFQSTWIKQIPHTIYLLSQLAIASDRQWKKNYYRLSHPTSAWAEISNYTKYRFDCKWIWMFRAFPSAPILCLVVVSVCLLVLISKANAMVLVLFSQFLLLQYYSKKKHLLFLFFRVFSIKTLEAAWGKKNSVMCTRKKKELLNGKKSWVEYTQKVKKERNNKNVHTYVRTQTCKSPTFTYCSSVVPLPPCLLCFFS